MFEHLTDPETMRQLIRGMSLVAWWLGVLSWLSVVVHAIRVPFNAQPGSLRGWLKLNPLNVVFFGDKLTPRGLVMRKRLIVSVVVFLACVANIMVAAHIIEVLSQA